MDINEIIAREMNGAIAKVAHERLARWDGPLAKLIDDAFIVHKDDIRAILYSAVSDGLSQETFRTEIKAAFMHALARNLMSEFKGEIEKQANAMRQQPEFRARVVMAIENIVSEA